MQVSSIKPVLVVYETSRQSFSQLVPGPVSQWVSQSQQPVSVLVSRLWVNHWCISDLFDRLIGQLTSHSVGM